MWIVAFVAGNLLTGNVAFMHSDPFLTEEACEQSREELVNNVIANSGVAHKDLIWTSKCVRAPGNPA
jgi:hypothetical protein